MANIKPFRLDRALRVDANVHGLFGECGPAGPGVVGVWTFMWVPDASWDGSMMVMGRIAGQEARDADVPLIAIPYIAIYLNSTIPASPRSWATDQIVSTSFFEVPTSNSSVGLVFNVNAGFGMLYLLDAMGGLSAS